MDEQVLWTIAVISAFVGIFLLTNNKKNGSVRLQSKRTFSELTVDVTQMAKDGKLDPFAGREAETDRTIHILLRRTKNNPLLIGAPGVGKTAIVHGLAQRIVVGDVPASLKNKRLLALDLAALLAETKYRGELEKRLRSLLQDLENKGDEVILFIDEIHMLVQAGGTEGALNVADVFKPALARGELQVIGATTWDEYAKYIRPDAPLDRRLQPVLVDEPSPEQALRILQSLRPAYEKFHKVSIPDVTLEAAVNLSDQKIKGRYLPDKAIDLIDEASAKVSVECSQAHHGVPMGIIHAAATDKKGEHEDIVTVEDIQDVVDQWVVHSDQDRLRDPRFSTII